MWAAFSNVELIWEGKSTARFYRALAEGDVLDGKMAGIAVSIGARVAARTAQAGLGEVLVSSTVKDLVAGSGIGFADRGAAELKGVPGEWRLYALERGGDAP